MAFCKFCGKELGEDGKCTCSEFQDNEKLESTLAEKNHDYDDSKPIKRGGMIKYIIALFAVIFICFVVICIMMAAASYKKPVTDLAKGISKADTEKIISAIYNDETVAEIRVRAKERGLTWDDYVKQNDKNIEANTTGLSIKHLKAKVTAKEKLDGSNLDAIKTYYSNTYSSKVKKAYRVEVEFTYRQNGEKKLKTAWLCVVKLKGEGWKYCRQYSESSYDFIDRNINFE